MNKYTDLEPIDQIVAEYVWIDGSGAQLRSKSRTLQTLDEIPI